MCPRVHRDIIYNLTMYMYNSIKMINIEGKEVYFIILIIGVGTGGGGVANITQIIVLLLYIDYY